MGGDIAYQGVVVAVLTLFSFFLGHYIESGLWEIPTQSADGTTMAFLTMSMAEMFHSLNMRSQRGSIFRLRTQNKTLWWALIAALAATTAVCEIPLLANAFGFTSVDLMEYCVAILLGALVIPVVETVKWIQRRGAKGKNL